MQALSGNGHGLSGAGKGTARMLHAQQASGRLVWGVFAEGGIAMTILYALLASIWILLFVIIIGISEVIKAIKDLREK